MSGRQRAGLRVLLVAALATAGAGCADDEGLGPEDNPNVLRDSTGMRFRWDCDDDGCSLAGAVDSTPEPFCGDDEPGLSTAWGRFFEVCAVCLSEIEGIHWTSSSGDCRPVACDNSRDCPQLYEYRDKDEYECVAGLCQNKDTGEFPRDVIRARDVRLLCSAVYPREETTDPLAEASQEVSAFVNEACPEYPEVINATCNEVPRECWQP